MQIKSGSRRIVFLFKNKVIKIPKFTSWLSFVMGVMENLHERYWWCGDGMVSHPDDWCDERSSTKHLAQIYWADRFGLMVVMERIHNTLEHLEKEYESCSDPEFLRCEKILKDNFGKIDICSDISPRNIGLRPDGTVVMIDYGYFGGCNQIYLGRKPLVYMEKRNNNPEPDEEKDDSNIVCCGSDNDITVGSEDMEENIWVVTKLWVDPSENQIGQAMGYDIIGYVATEEEAASIVVNSPKREGTGWPIREGEKLPIYKISKLKKLDINDLDAQHKHDAFSVDWAANVGKLRRLHELAGDHQVDFMLNYCDGAHEWYVQIDGATSDESFIGKDRSVFGIALDDAIEHLEKI